ncbi:MAG TPA: CBS domain-containing protein [Paucimonas sp.]|nr:CBS domain-containing protein [Paucimonas sp.]
MDKPIYALLDPNQITVDTEDTLERVEAVLDDNNLDYVPVVDMGGGIFGVISMHEIVHFHSHKRNPKAVLAWEVCTHRLFEVDALMSVREVAKLMATKRIHHVTVMENGNYRGVIALLDLVERYLLVDPDALYPERKPSADDAPHASAPHSYSY